VSKNLDETLVVSDGTVSKTSSVSKNLDESISFTDSLSTSSISFPDDWNKKVLSTNSTMVSGSYNLSNFPVLVTLTGDSDLSTSKVGSSGQGIRFTSDGATLLDYEIEKYTGDADSGTLVAWVEIPTLYHDKRTLFYIHYGQTSSPDMQDAYGTWDGSYTHVYHLGEEGLQTSTKTVPQIQTTDKEEVVHLISKITTHQIAWQERLDMRRTLE